MGKGSRVCFVTTSILRLGDRDSRTSTLESRRLGSRVHIFFELIRPLLFVVLARLLFLATAQIRIAYFMLSSPNIVTNVIALAMPQVSKQHFDDVAPGSEAVILSDDGDSPSTSKQWTPASCIGRSSNSSSAPPHAVLILNQPIENEQVFVNVCREGTFITKAPQ